MALLNSRRLLQQQLGTMDESVDRLWHRTRRPSPPRALVSPPPPPRPPPERSLESPGPPPLLVAADSLESRSPRSPRGLANTQAYSNYNGEGGLVAKLLRGLEEEALTVNEVLSMLESELKSQVDSTPPRFVSQPSPILAGTKFPRDRYPAPASVPARGSDCSRCAVLEQQVRAAAQSLAGLGARVFNWSLTLSPSVQQAEQAGLGELVLMYLEPCVHIDERIADSCRALRASLGNAGPSGPSAVPKYYGGLTMGAPRAGEGHADRQRTAYLEQALTHAMHPPASAIARGAPVVTSLGRSEAADFGGVHQALEKGPADEVVVTFTASYEGKKLNGSYFRKPGVQMNGRTVYVRGREHLVFIDDGTWVIKEGASGDTGAYVYAYCEDAAPEPFATNNTWHVMDDDDGFVADVCARIMPGPRKMRSGD